MKEKKITNYSTASKLNTTNDLLINKVAQSGLITIDLEELYPKGERVIFDLKEVLFLGLILKEKDFREFLKNENWGNYKNKFVSIICSADAIVPTWAYMLLSLHLQPFANRIVFGNLEVLEIVLFNELLSQLPIETYKDARIVIKGCGKLPIPIAAYVELTQRLRPIAKSLMYGEPCSTVPLFKQAK